MPSKEIIVTDDDNTQSVFALDDVRFTEVGLHLPVGLPFEIWEQMVGTIDRIRKGIDWAYGDALNYGQAEYGEMYAQAIQVTGKSYSHLSTCKYVASIFPMEKRRPGLSFDHHAAVASIMRVDPASAMEILDKAEEGDLDSKETRWDAKQMRIALGMEEAEPNIDHAPNGTPEMRKVMGETQWLPTNGATPPKLHITMGGQEPPTFAGAPIVYIEDKTEGRIMEVTKASDLMAILEDFLFGLQAYQSPSIDVEHTEDGAYRLVLAIETQDPY